MDWEIEFYAVWDTRKKSQGRKRKGTPGDAKEVVTEDDSLDLGDSPALSPGANTTDGLSLGRLDLRIFAANQ